MSGKISIDLVKMRSERTRKRLFLAGGVINTAAAMLDRADGLTEPACVDLREALLLVAQTLDAAAWTLDADTITEAPNAEERGELGEDEPERREFTDAELASTCNGRMNWPFGQDPRTAPPAFGAAFSYPATHGAPLSIWF